MYVWKVGEKTPTLIEDVRDRIGFVNSAGLPSTKLIQLLNSIG